MSGIQTKATPEGRARITAKLREIAARVRLDKQARRGDITYVGTAFLLVTGDESAEAVDKFSEGIIDPGPDGFAEFCDRLAAKAAESWPTDITP